MSAAARITDPISCGDHIGTGSPNVHANDLNVARKTEDTTTSHVCGPTTHLAQGSPDVWVNNLAFVRVGDAIVPHGTCDDPPHQGTVSSGSSSVFVNSSGTALSGAAGIQTVVLAASQPGVSSVDLADHLNDDPGSDRIYQSYQKQVYKDSNIAPVEGKTTKQAAEPTTAPAEVPTNCDDVNAVTGTFPGSFQLSPHFTLSQLTTNTLVSNYALKAQVGLTEKQIVCNLRALCVNVLEPLYTLYGSTLRINSGFRHGSGTSQHYKGEACDVSFTDVTTATAQFARAELIQNQITYDQYIYEQNNSIWHHLSYSTANRRQVLTKPRGNQYYPGLRMIS